MLHFLSSAGVHDLVQTYGLWLVFVLIMLESMGIPLPGETAFVSAALYAGTTHGIGIVPVVAVAAAAAIVGDNIGYVIGCTVGFRLLVRYGRYVHLDEGRPKVGQYLFLRHGGKIVFFGRFVALLRASAALLAGSNRMAWSKFLLMKCTWRGLLRDIVRLWGLSVRRSHQSPRWPCRFWPLFDRCRI